MDPVWGFADAGNDFEYRRRSPTPFPGFTPPPESPEPPRFPHHHFWERPVTTPGERGEIILTMLEPVVGPIDPEERCMICLDPFPAPTDEDRGPAVQLVCRHAYCRGCIMTWLLEKPNNSCPYCRHQLWEEPMMVTLHDDSDSEVSSSTVGEEDGGDDGDTVMGDDGGEEGEDHDEEEVADSGDEMDEGDHDSVPVVSSDGDESEDDVQLGTMYVGGLRRSARHRGH